MFNLQIKIWHKLFFTILLVIVLILAINVWLSRVNFQQGFSQYIEEVKSRRLDRFRQSLSEQFRLKESWDFLQEDPRLWHQLLSDAELAPPGPPGVDIAEFDRHDPARRVAPPPDFGPPDRPPHRRPPPPGEATAEFEGQDPARNVDAPPDFGPPDRPPHRRPPPPGEATAEFEGHDPFRPGDPPLDLGWPEFPPPGYPPPPPPFMWERIGLLDQERKAVIGPPPGTEQRLLSIELNEEVVGYLVIQDFKTLRSQLDLQFAQQQLEDLLLTALLSLLIAVIAALLLARLFNRPISRLVGMARQLTFGQFDTRIEINSRDELGYLAADLNKLADTLEQNQTARQQWIADISHELRTPLTVLTGELEAMEDGIRPLNTESIQSLSLEVKQLKRLVEDLYLLSQSDQGSLSYEMEQIDIFKLLHGVLEGYRIPMQRKQIELVVDCEEGGLQIIADPQRLVQLFNNLLENSLRYTDHGGRVQVSCKIGSTLVIHIEDSAPGVPAEFIPRIFERLFRVNRSRSREHGGTGLGLSIVHSIARAHGGELSAEPSELGGLKISLQLPIKLKH